MFLYIMKNTAKELMIGGRSTSSTFAMIRPSSNAIGSCVRRPRCQEQRSTSNYDCGFHFISHSSSSRHCLPLNVIPLAVSLIQRSTL